MRRPVCKSTYPKLTLVRKSTVRVELEAEVFIPPTVPRKELTKVPKSKNTCTLDGTMYLHVHVHTCTCMCNLFVYMCNADYTGIHNFIIHVYSCTVHVHASIIYYCTLHVHMYNVMCLHKSIINKRHVMSVHIQRETERELVKEKVIDAGK